MGHVVYGVVLPSCTPGSPEDDTKPGNPLSGSNFLAEQGAPRPDLARPRGSSPRLLASPAVPISRHHN